MLRSRALLTRVTIAAVLLTVNWTSYVYAIVHGHIIETALGYFVAPVGTMLVFQCECGVAFTHDVPLRDERKSQHRQMALSS